MKCCALVLTMVLCSCGAFAVAPTVSSVSVRQLPDGTGLVQITYDLTDPDSARVLVSVQISTDGGATFSKRSYITGDGWVRPGSRLTIWWDAKACLGDNTVSTDCRAKITVQDMGGNAYAGEMVYIPEGPFMMGNSGSESFSYADELPQHLVHLAGYWIGKYEVTRGEYSRFVAAGGYSDSSYWSADGWNWKVSNNRTQPAVWASGLWDWGTGGFLQSDSHPVVGISYYECEAYCNWIGGHLPTEAQWEKAARWTGTDARTYPWGNAWDPERCNNYNDHGAAGGGYQKKQSSPIDGYSDSASNYGCRDMAGNAWEWCKDWYLDTYYSQLPPGGWIEPQGPENGQYRSIRGGSWYDGNDGCRCAYRNCTYPHNSYTNVGFRVAR